MERALLRFDGFFGDSVGGIPFGGKCVRGPSLPFRAGCGGSAFEVEISVGPPASKKVLRKVNFRELGMLETRFPRIKVSDRWVKKAGVPLRLRISASAHDPLPA